MNEPAPDIQQGLCAPPSSFAAAGVPSAEQAESVSAWLGWHAAELVGVGVPLALAALVSAWLMVLAVPAAGLWAANETRQRRAQIRAAERGALTSPETTTYTDTTSDEETER